MADHSKTCLVVERDGVKREISIFEWEALSGVKFLPQIRYDSESLQQKISHEIQKLYKKGNLTRQQLWFGSYFKKEIFSNFIPDIYLRFINTKLGWGVFAARNFKKMDYIATYSGVVRKSKKSDNTNAYCFEYTLTNGIKTPYTIDAQDEGGISRYINHSQKANLQSSLATIDFLNYVVLIASKPIAKDSQLFYDYGPDYWAHRETPEEFDDE